LDASGAASASPFLEARIAALEARVAALEERSDWSIDPESMDQVGALAERVMERFFDMVGEMQREFQ
jgi:hypothetical protein